VGLPHCHHKAEIFAVAPDFGGFVVIRLRRQWHFHLLTGLMVMDEI
jgi:hypothetical protein